MRITYDPGADVAYIQLVDTIGVGGVVRTVACDPAELGGMIHLDFDTDGRLVGIEVLGASGMLPAQVLRESPE